MTLKDTVVIAATAVALALIYALSCWLWPLAHCACCKGSGRHSRKDGKVFRPCRWCTGSGRRWRIGRRVWSSVQRRRKATR